MLSPNLAIRKAYLSLLSTITYLGSPVPVYWTQLPTTVSPGIFIIYGQIRNQDVSDKTSSITDTIVTVSVYTNSLKYNDGVAVDTVANEVLNRLYKRQGFKIDLGQFFQIISTNLVADFTQDFSQDKQNIYIDRIMLFNHRIFQNVS